ncbi:MAG TPA: hypothetical protein VK994_01475 [Bacteroidales bacterium]|nr:hypothetical protein [Bacteroidales bacterium]
MKNSLFLPAMIWLLLLQACTTENNDHEFRAGSMGIRFDPGGKITALYDDDNGIDYLHPDSLTYLVHMRFDKEIIEPVSMKYIAEESTMYFYFPADHEVKIKVGEHDRYISFELVDIRSNDKPDLLVWGPVFTGIGQTIGETVGVVRDQKFAIGIQSLNPKTLGGYPWLESDVMPEMDYFDQDDYSDLKKGGIGHTLYRIEAARPVKGGSVLHAYCRNRYYERSIENWGYNNYVVKPYEDDGLIGSSIAIFGCPPDQVLPTLAEIEVEEGLPHPTLNGEWSKTAKGASAVYMILDFGRDDIEKALSYVEKAGLKYLYHSGPFETWGHFVLNEGYFPEGRKSLKECTEIAGSKGISIGLHTLSNFITTNDAYVTPVPDRRLAAVGSTQVLEAIGKGNDRIIIGDPAHFNQFTNNYLKAARIGDEIVRYAAVSETEPWQLLDCQRGAFGTDAAPHASGDTIIKLADHAYKVLLSNPELTVEIAKNIADLYNETGVRQISFDGLEGCRSTGLGNYGEILLTTTWYDHLNDDIRSHFIADASRTTHFFWHIFTRMNWGEPWYAGFRESQTEYRLKNQKYFDRNYIPNMLGWFLMRPNTSIEDIEWLTARSAAFDAGFAFVTSYEALEKNGLTNDILDAIGLWEKARQGNAFTPELRELMKDVNNEFHLEATDEKTLMLRRIYPHRISYTRMPRQPGEPGHSSLEFETPEGEQVLQFIITSAKGKLLNPVLEIDGNRSITVPAVLNEGEHIKYDGAYAGVYSADWRLLKSISLDAGQLTLDKGIHKADVTCEFAGSEGEMKVELRISGETEIIHFE